MAYINEVIERAKADGNNALARRIETERKILRKTIKAFLEAGHSISLNDGEETTVRKSRSLNELMDAAFTTDEDYLYIHDDEGKRVGFIYFVYGNDGFDVINDYSTSLEPIMAPINKYCDSLE